MQSNQSAFAQESGSDFKLVLLLLFSSILMIADYRSGYLHSLRHFGQQLTAPLISLAQVPGDTWSWVGRYFSDKAHLNERLVELEEKNSRLQLTVQLLDELESENSALKSLLAARKLSPGKVLTTRIRKVDLDPYSHRVLIDRGSSDGVYVGQSVLDAFGVVGQVQSVAGSSAFVMLISDPSHALPVKFKRTKLRAIAFGSGNAEVLNIPNLPLSADIRVGDVLVTSGLGGRFNSGFPVAKVFELSKVHGEAFAVAKAVPLAHLNRSSFLLLVSYQDKENGVAVVNDTADPETGPAQPGEAVGG